MLKIYANIDKRLIEQLPPVLFEGRIFTINTVEEADRAVEYLKTFPMIGLDTETRPNFQKGPGYKVGLLQLSTLDTCFLFRLHRIGIPDSLMHLLASRKQVKIGLSMKDDIRALNGRREFKFGRYVELQSRVREVGMLDMSLQKIYANFFGRKISKSKRLTNWEAQNLTEAQKRYAATDAWACLQIYNLLEELRTGMDYEYISPMDDNRMYGIWQNHLLADTFGDPIEEVGSVVAESSESVKTVVATAENATTKKDTKKKRTPKAKKDTPKTKDSALKPKKTVVRAKKPVAKPKKAASDKNTKATGQKAALAKQTAIPVNKKQKAQSSKLTAVVSKPVGTASKSTPTKSKASAVKSKASVVKSSATAPKTNKRGPAVKRAVKAAE